MDNEKPYITISSSELQKLLLTRRKDVYFEGFNSVKTVVHTG